MRPGEVRRKITIQAATTVADDYGGSTQTLADVAEVWATIQPLEGREQLLAMQTGMTRPHRFSMRYREDVTGASRILYDGRAFNVTSVTDPGARHRELVVLADEEVG